MVAARVAQEKAVAEYTVANAGKELVEVAGLSDQIAAAAEKKRKEEEEALAAEAKRKEEEARARIAARAFFLI